jgi:multidrug efflux pump subunit AcrA (membrane-fusion protein)
MNKKILIAAMFLPVLTLISCGGALNPAPVPTVVVETPESNAPSFGSGVIASAEIVPAKTIELSFPMIGIVTTVEVEVGDTVKSGQVIAGLDTTILEARVAEAEANVLDRVGTSDEQMEKAQSDVDRASALAEQAKANLAQATLYSPVGGTVVSLEISPGETVTPGQVVIVIADLTQMQVETTDLSERDILAVQIGQQTKVFIEALDDYYDGRVTDIARRSSIVGGDVVFAVTIELDEQPEGLRWGMSAEVEIQTEQ